ncbi:ribbon-helix-helix domain-containing protein [Fulvimarina sp. MAC8]|uniref:ribbon-helix-helix domain-containing protein n=1 Tax=Fulvimarina sp. MAC8 TaxID=3162874 RepID=UPI0032F064BE
MCQMFAGIAPEEIEGETRSVRLSGHSTSIRLEAAFWRTLEHLAESQGMSLAKFLTKLHDEVLDLRGEVKNFASHLRCACLVHLEHQRQSAATSWDREAGESKMRTLHRGRPLPLAS